MPKIRMFAFPRILATLACLSFNALAAQAVAETSAPPVCGVGGAFGISFGEKISSTQVPLRTFFFGRGCYQVSPPTPHRYFDTYAACVSEFDGEVFQIQALKVFDDTLPKGSSSLSPAQRESNRRLGQQVLDGLFAQLPAAMSAIAKINSGTRSWELLVADGVTLEVSNHVEWAVTLECRNEAMTQKVFRRRIHGNRQ